MAKASEPAVTTDEIIFELERFERSDGHLILRGRWFGVRGRRFVRPTLTLEVGGERLRALADLDDKPWPAEDGEPWRASFPWGKNGRVQEAELSVAPDITLQLPAPGAKRTRAQRLSAQPRREAMAESFGPWSAPSVTPGLEEAPSAPADEPLAPADEPLGPADEPLGPADEPAPPAAVAVAEDEPEAPPPAPPPAPDPEALQAEIDALREQLTAARSSAVETAGRLDSVQEELATLRRELEQAQGQVGVRDGELEAARGELAKARAELANARAGREAALRSAAQAEADRDDALSRTTQTEAERDALAREKSELTVALEERRSAFEQLKREHEDVVASRGAALVMRGATQALPAYEHHVGWVRRVLAVVVLLGIIFAVLIVLNVL